MIPAINLLSNNDNLILCAIKNKIDNFEIPYNDKYSIIPNVISVQSLFNNISYTNIFSDIEKEEKYSDILIFRINNFYKKYKSKNFVFGSPKFRNVNSSEEFNLSIKFFKKVCDAIPDNVILSLENCAKEYGTNFGTTFSECLNIILEVNKKNFKINFDIGSFIQSKDNIKNVINNINYINHVHVSRFGLLPISELSNEEILNYKNIVCKLIENGYNNAISLEVNLKNKTYSSIDKEIKIFKEILNI